MEELSNAVRLLFDGNLLRRQDSREQFEAMTHLVGSGVALLPKDGGAELPHLLIGAGDAAAIGFVVTVVVARRGGDPESARDEGDRGATHHTA